MKTPPTFKGHINILTSRNLKFNQLNGFCMGLVLMLFFPARIFTQTDCEIINPTCIEYIGPVFPGGTTLCETFSSFTPDYTIPNGKKASELHLTLWPYNDPGFDFYDKDILIQGIFYLDVPVAFMSCRVKLNPGAQIIVADPGETPTLTEMLSFRSKFFACEEMWKGIIIGHGNRCRIFSSHIEDAQFGLTVEDHVSLTLLSNRFNRNFVSITNDSENTKLPFLLFKNNIFDCTSELNDYYDLDFSNFDEDPVSYAGVFLNNCSSSIGYFESGNYFKNLNFGILANNSSVHIKGCTFIDAQHATIIPDLFPESPAMGAGVVGINSSVFIVGDDENVSAKFINADLTSIGTNLYVEFAEFEDSSIDAGEGYAGQTVSINDNSFSSIEGVSIVAVQRSAASGDATHTFINRNSFTHSSPNFPLFFIHVIGTLSPTDHAFVDSDTIKFYDECMTGIRFTVWDSENTTISNNQIEMDGRIDNVKGIYSLLGITKGSFIEDNTIDGGIYYDDFSPSAGIHTWAVRGLELCHNISDRLGYGLVFSGDCENTNFAQNDINIHGIGLFLRDNFGVPGVFGVQNATLNEWLDDSYEYQYYAANSISTADLFFSRYFIASENASEEKYNPVNINPSSGWFIPASIEHDLCLPEPKPFVSSFDSLIINDNTFFETLPEPVSFYLESKLISLILNDEDMIDDYGAYLSSMEEESEYILAKAKVDLKSALQMEINDQDHLDSLIAIIDETFKLLLPFDDYNYSNIDSITFAEGIRLDSVTAILGRCSGFTEAQQIIKDERTSSLNADLEGIADDLDNFTPRAVYDNYYKTIYALFIKKIIDGNLTPEDYIDLNLIAHDDEDSSLANITAFALFNLCSEHSFPDYAELEEEFVPLTKHLMNENPKANSPKKYIIFEIDEGVYIKLHNEVSGVLSFYDMSGRLVYNQEITNEVGRVNINQQLIPGIYYWVFSENVSKLVHETGMIQIL